MAQGKVARQRVPGDRARTETIHTPNQIQIRFVFGRFTRIVHWLRVALIGWFVFSGLYLASPFFANRYDGPTTETILVQFRSWHVLAGWLLIALTLVRIYEFLFVRSEGRALGLGTELRMGRVLVNWRAWREQLAYYFLFRKEHPRYVYSNYGPLQYVVYTALYALLIAISITGILLAAPYQPDGLAGASARLLEPIGTWMGGLAGVRRWHHWFTWGVILFMVLHIYMVAWNSIRGRTLELESIVSGYKRAE